jgi:hypothetical protein
MLDGVPSASSEGAATTDRWQSAGFRSKQRNATHPLSV